MFPGGKVANAQTQPLPPPACPPIPGFTASRRAIPTAIPDGDHSRRRPPPSPGASQTNPECDVPAAVVPPLRSCLIAREPSRLLGLSHTISPSRVGCLSLHGRQASFGPCIGRKKGSAKIPEPLPLHPLWMQAHQHQASALGLADTTEQEHCGCIPVTKLGSLSLPVL